jgi:hypothetical protein
MVIEDVTGHTDPVVFKGSLSDTATSFREKVGTHPEGDKAVIAGFWYHGAGSTQILFDLNDDDAWLKFQNNIRGKRRIEATWYNLEQDCASPST